MIAVKIAGMVTLTCPRCNTRISTKHGWPDVARAVLRSAADKRDMANWMRCPRCQTVVTLIDAVPREAPWEIPLLWTILISLVVAIVWMVIALLR